MVLCSCVSLLLHAEQQGCAGSFSSTLDNILSRMHCEQLGISREHLDFLFRQDWHAGRSSDGGVPTSSPPPGDRLGLPWSVASVTAQES